MKKLMIFSVFAVFLLFITACDNAKDNAAGDDTQIANPASEHCIEQGGSLELRDNDLGTYGVCIFEDGSECEEWAFFREECSMGDSLVEVTDFASCKENEGMLLGISLDQCEFEGVVYTESGKMITLSACDGYFDGCNNCIISDGKIVGCTKMYCDEPAEPECRTEESDEEQDLQDKGTSCENIGGTYLEEFDECEGISEDGCAALGGTFDPCGSACRNDPDAEFCTMQCVPFCSFS